MKLRTILLVLALLAFLSASIGGLFYFHSLKEFAFEEAGKVAAVKASTVKDRVASYLSENLQIIKALAGIRALQQALAGEDARSLENASSLLANLDYFDDALGYDSCFLLDRAGNAIASSAPDGPVGFAGENHKSSSFVRLAMQGIPAFYMSRSNNQQQPDVYFSHPVYGENKDTVIGVVVIRASTGPIEYELKQFNQGIVLLVDPHGEIFASNHKDWLYQRLWGTAPDVVSGTAAKQAVVQGSSSSVGLELRDEKYAVDGGGNEYLIYQMAMVNYPGWKIIYLVSLDEISESLLAPLLGTSGYAILILCLLVGGSVLFLYRIASRDIAQRKTAEEAR